MCAHAVAQLIIRIDPVDDETAGSGGDVREAHRRRVGLAEDHVALACGAGAARVGAVCPHDEIGQAVTVDISGTGHADA